MSMGVSTCLADPYGLFSDHTPHLYILMQRATVTTPTIMEGFQNCKSKDELNLPIDDLKYMYSFHALLIGLYYSK